MLFSQFLFSGLGAVSVHGAYLLAIAILACILGAEIAGICILIAKMHRARKRKQEEDLYRHYGVGGVLLFAAVGQAEYNALLILGGLAVLAAVVFAVLLIVARICGFDFAVADRKKEVSAAEEIPEEEPEVEELPAEVETQPAEVEEEQRQYAYTEPVAETQYAVEEPEEELPEAVAEEVSAAEEAVAETLPEEESVAESVTEEPVPAPAQEPAAAVEPVQSKQTSTTVVQEGPAFADGTQPYKVVEKVVTETVKEVYKENPQPAPQPAPEAQGRSGLSDSVVEKLVDLLDFELRTRHEMTRNEEDSKEKEEETKNGSVATFAASDVKVLDEEDDDEDEDEDERDDPSEDKDEDDEERDDEENDTEGDHFTGNERIIGFDEETGCYIVAHYRKSFEAKLIQSRPNIKQYYSELKNALLSYKGTKNRISWTADSFHNGRNAIAKINVKTRILELYLALDPASLEGTVYRGKDVGSKKKYADTPFQYKLRTPRKFKWAMELVQRVCEEHGLSPIDIEHVDYEAMYPFDTTENLVERKLIKEYIREEKPATSFELDPDHVPTVPNEDETVIPANANFSWEFDNERMEEQEPDPIPEIEPEPEPEPIPEPEPEPAPEPTPEPAPAPAPAPTPGPSIFRETVKVTEMRYTERYYNDAKPTYEQVITTSEPIEVLPEPTAPEMSSVQEASAQEVAAQAIPVEEPSVDVQAANAEPVAEEMPAERSVWASLESTIYDAVPDAAADPLYTELEELPEEASEQDEEAADGQEEELYPEEERYFDDQPEEETLGTEDTYEADESAEDATYEEAYEDGDYEEESYVEAYANIDEASYEEPFDEAEAYEGEEADEEPSYAEPVVEAVDEPIPEEKPKVAVNPAVALIDICSAEAHYNEGDVVSLESLKRKQLVLPSATTLKIYASGTLSKSLTVEANHFTLDAIKAISDADGDSVMVR